MESVGSPIQNIHKMTYGDENATFEPLPEMLRNARKAGLNLSTRDRLLFFFIYSERNLTAKVRTFYQKVYPIK